MKKRNVSLVSLLLLSSLFSLSLGSSSESVLPTKERTALKAADSSSWTATGGNYTIDNNVITVSNNTSKNNGFFITDQYDTLGDYTVSVSAIGTRGFPMERETDIGVVPWYIDNNNYILVYMNWSNSDRPSELREIQITGRINGKALVVKSGSSWTQKEWNDHWTDGMAVKENSTNTIKVSKIRSASKDSDIIKVIVNDTISASLEVRDTVQFDHTKAKVGVYGYDDTITFSNFSFEKETGVSQFKAIGNGIGRSENGSLSYSEGKYTIDAKSSSDMFSNIALLKNANAAGGYDVIADFASIEEGENGVISLIPYYENEYSYLSLGIRKEAGKLYAFTKGRRATSLSAALTFEEIDEKKEIHDISALSEIKMMKIAKSDGTFILSINNSDKELISYTNAYFVQGNNSFPDKLFGFALAGVKLSVSSLSTAVSYNEYSFLEKKLGGKTVFVSARTDNSVSFADNSYHFSEEAITKGDASKQAAVYYASNKYGNVNMEAYFSNLTSQSSFGLYSCLFDINNYVKVYIDISTKKIIIDNAINGAITKKETDLPSDFDINVTSHKLASVLKNEALSLSLDGKAVLTDEKITIDLHEEAKVGFLGGGASFDVKDIKVSGFTPLDPIDIEDFTFFGQRVDSWHYDKENKVISNKLINGIDNGWKATNALYKNTEKKNLYVGSAITVNERTGNEWKVGVMPYYKDADNHVIVWFSQWSDGGCKIVVTARLNGRIIGNEWRESGDIGVNMLEKNYLEASIIDNKVSVYLNKGFTPIFETTIDGLENRNMEMAFTGFQSGNGIAATFSEFTMVSDKRIYGFKEKPVIQETGTRKTEGTVGNVISLPIYTAENSAGDFLTPVIKVTGPDGNEVEISKNRFTPDKAGTYHVNVTCVDAWGNEADPLDYDIVVKEGYVAPDDKTTDKTTADVESSDKTSENKPSEKKGCSGSVIAASSLLGSLTLLATGLVIKKRKEK